MFRLISCWRFHVLFKRIKYLWLSVNCSSQADAEKKIFTRGCLQAFNEWVDNNGFIVAVILIVVIIPQVSEIKQATCCLYQSYFASKLKKITPAFTVIMLGQIFFINFILKKINTNTFYCYIIIIRLLPLIRQLFDSKVFWNWSILWSKRFAAIKKGNNPLVQD